MSTYKKWMLRKRLIRHWNPIVEWVVSFFSWFIVDEPDVIFPLRPDGSFYSEEYMDYLHKRCREEANGQKVSSQS